MNASEALKEAERIIKDGIWKCQECLRDEVAVDWGSYAFRGNASEIGVLFRKLKWGSVPLEEGKDYAVVFIEEV